MKIVKENNIGFVGMSLLAVFFVLLSMTLKSESVNEPEISDTENNFEEVRTDELSPRFEKIKKIRMFDDSTAPGYVIRDKERPMHCYLMTQYYRSSSLMKIPCDF